MTEVEGAADQSARALKGRICMAVARAAKRFRDCDTSEDASEVAYRLVEELRQVGTGDEVLPIIAELESDGEGSDWRKVYGTLYRAVQDYWDSTGRPAVEPP